MQLGGREVFFRVVGGARSTLFFLDSYHRFIHGWDQQVITVFEDLRHAGISKPIVTGDPAPYDPHADPGGRTQVVFRIHLRERYKRMLFRLIGHEIRNWRQLTSPVPANFASLHFLFADGLFNRELAFDPSIYFFADELTIALRAFTYRYDLFHPQERGTEKAGRRSARRTRVVCCNRPMTNASFELMALAG